MAVEDTFKLSEHQDLLTQSLLATNHVQDCAIISLKTSSVVSISLGFKLDPGQVQAFLNAFNQPNNFRDDGLYFKNITYSCVRADSNSVYGKHDNVGLVLVKTGLYVICATYREGMYPSVCVEAAEKLDCERDHIKPSLKQRFSSHVVTTNPAMSGELHKSPETGFAPGNGICQMKIQRERPLLCPGFVLSNHRAAGLAL
ncbi:profilin-4 isoform X2 [Scyliorhinus torazame]|uniref:profilin-4 isoform X2 n=1 Tax=Scyliorhinus torazame TaxID=75743 RepID=UPI003B5B1FE8